MPVYTSLYTATTEDIRKNSCMQRMSYLEIVQMLQEMLQEREPLSFPHSFRHSTNESDEYTITVNCVLCVRAHPGAVWVS